MTDRRFPTASTEPAVSSAERQAEVLTRQAARRGWVVARKVPGHRASCVWCRRVFQTDFMPGHLVDKHAAELAARGWSVVLR